MIYLWDLEMEEEIYVVIQPFYNGYLCNQNVVVWQDGHFQLRLTLLLEVNQLQLPVHLYQDQCVVKKQRWMLQNV